MKRRMLALLLAVLTLTMLTAAAFAEDTEVLGVYNVTGPLTVTNGNTTATTVWSAQMKITNTQTGLVSYVDLGSGAAIAASASATKTINSNSINLYQAIVTINGTTVVSNQIAG